MIWVSNKKNTIDVYSLKSINIGKRSSILLPSTDKSFGNLTLETIAFNAIYSGSIFVSDVVWYFSFSLQFIFSIQSFLTAPIFL